MGDTLAELLREAGIQESPASRYAREGAPPPLPRRPPLNTPGARRYNERRQAPAVREDFARNAPRQAYAPMQNQFEQIPQALVDTTGVPNLYRAYEGYQNAQDWPDPRQRTDAMQAANERAIFGGMAAAGWLTPGLRGRDASPVRAPMREPFPDFGVPERMPPRPQARPDAGSAQAELNRELPDGGGAVPTDSLPALERALRDAGARGPIPTELPQRTLPLDAIEAVHPRRMGIEEERLAHQRANPSSDPILVRRDAQGRWRIIDGGHRVTVARERGAVNVEVLDATDLFSEQPNGSPSRPPDGAKSMTPPRKPPQPGGFFMPGAR